MLDFVKKSLWITTTAYDDILVNLINAALIDLGMSGISPYNEEPDPIITLAVTTFVKMHFGDPSDPEGLAKAYHSLKTQLAVSFDYGDLAC